MKRPSRQMQNSIHLFGAATLLALVAGGLAVMAPSAITPAIFASLATFAYLLSLASALEAVKLYFAMRESEFGEDRFERPYRPEDPEGR